MSSKLRFKCHFQIEPLESEGIYLLSEQEYFLLKGELYRRIVPLINGDNSADDVVDQLTREFPPTKIYYALHTLLERGFITESSHASTTPRRQTAFWELLSVEPGAATDRLKSTVISLVPVGSVPLDSFASAVDSLGLKTTNNIEDGDFVVALTDDYLREELRDLNADALTAGRPWALVKPVGAVAWIGPIFRPTATACWECLAQRIESNRPIEPYLRGRKGSACPLVPSRATLPTIVQAACNLAALEIAKSIIREGYDAKETTALTTLNFLDFTMERHIVVRRPQCRCCGSIPSPRKVEPAPVLLSSQPIKLEVEGGHRTVSPTETLRSYEHHISAITGVVRYLHSVAPSDGPTSVYNANYQSAGNAQSPHVLRKHLRANSAGKGTTDTQARTSALCEALERHSGIFQGYEPRMLASYRGLQKTAIHPNECMLFSEAQYDSGSQSQSFNAIPRPLDVDARIEWTPVWSLTERCHKYLPTSYCYYGYPIPAAASYCWADSNGAAAGNTIEEAVLQGLLELVERDCVALWWYNRVQRPQVDLKSFGIPYIQQLEKHYLNLGRSIWVLDISSDLNIPSFAAISRRTNDPKEEIGLGFGSHLDPRIGVVRALTELNQFLAEADFYNRQRIGHSPDELDEADRLFRRWFEAATLENQPYLAANESADLATCESYPATWRDDIRENILFIQNNLSRRGMEVLVLDQTRPDVGLAVAKVFVPGLRHFWARFAPGRLYDVPVEIGWLNRPLSEHELNPIHMFL